MYKSIKLTSLRKASEDCGIPNIGQLFCAQIEDDWRYEVSGLALRYDQYVHIDSIFIKLQNGLLYYCQQFHCPTYVQHLELDCKVEHTNTNQGIMPESYHIWVQYTENVENDHNNNFQGRVPCVSIPYLSCTPPNLIFQYPECLPPEQCYRPCPKGVNRPRTGYYVLNPKTMRRWFQWSWKICMVRLIVLTGLSGLSDTLIRSIL